MGRQKKKKTNRKQKERRNLSEKSSERVLNEIQARQLPDDEFKTMVIRKLNELTVKLPKTTWKLRGTYCKLYQHEKGNRKYQQEQRGNEEYNF